MKTERWRTPLLSVAALALVFFGGWRCPLRWAFHVPCPSCGLWRATHFALHGEWAHAHAMHPLVWIVVPVVALFLGVELVGFVRRGTWGASRELPYANAVLSLTAGALFVVWIARFAGAFGGPVSS